MAFRLSTGFRNEQLGDSLSTWSNVVALGEDTTVADLSASWTASGTALTGNNTVSGRTGVLSLSAAAGTITQSCTVIPGHTYRLEWDAFSDGTTDGIKADIGTTTLDDDVYSGISFTAPATWTTYGNATDVSLYEDDGTASVNDGAIVFKAGASTTAVHLTFTRTGTTDIISLDNIRLVDQARSLGEIFRGGNIKIYSGTQPTSPNDAPTGTLLVTIDNGGTGFTFNDAASGSVAKASAETWSGTCGATGTAGWARMVTPTDTGASSTADPRIDMAVGTSGAQINFSSTSFTSGSTQTITAFSISIPQG